MARISLDTKLETEKKLNSNIVVSTNLLKELEVVGYVNSRMIDLSGLNFDWTGSVNMAPNQQFICSYYLNQKQPDYPDSKSSFNSKGSPYRVIPIYKTIQIVDTKEEFEISNLYIPSLLNNDVYKKIKARIKNYIVAQHQIKVLNDDRAPFEMYEKNGIAYMTTKVGDRVFVDNNKIVSIAENTMAVCRYLFPQTGEIHYASFGLYELFCDI